MKLLSIEPFVPSGKDFDGSKQLFQELGFAIRWETEDLVGFEKDGCKFILQQYDVAGFSENYMLSVRINNVEEFYAEAKAKNLIQRFGIRISPPTAQPYGIEVNLVDIAGVCWHFIE